MKNVNELISEYNLKLKVVGIKLSIQKRNNRLQIRGTLPVKKHLIPSRGDKPYQQVINLGSLAIANESGIIYAFKQAKIVYGQLQSNTFDWENWEINKKQDKTNILNIWENYKNFKKDYIKANTLKIDYRTIESHIQTLENLNIKDPEKIKNYLLQNLTLRSAKKTLMYIKAAYSYALETNLVLSNPFDNVHIRIKNVKKSEWDIQPFSKIERDIIINSFENHIKYYDYASLVKFLFFTGCRPSEATGLQWKHITEKHIIFEQNLTRHNGIQPGLKRQKFRIFPVNLQLLEIIKELKLSRTEVNKDDFVFLTKSGKLINFNYFQYVIWKGKNNDGILNNLVKNGLISNYRKPYQMRHTFITLCLESGVNVKDVAAWVGNTPEIIYKHYAGVNRFLEVPEI